MRGNPCTARRRSQHPRSHADGGTAAIEHAAGGPPLRPRDRWGVDMADVGSMAVEPRGHCPHEAIPGDQPSMMQSTNLQWIGAATSVTSGAHEEDKVKLDVL